MTGDTAAALKDGVGKSKQGLASRAVAATVLTRVIDDGRGLDGLLDTRHGPPAYKKLTDDDRNLVRAIATTAFRHRGQILFVFDQLMKRPPPRNARHLHHTLHVAAAQILFMNVPDSAAVDLAVTSISNEKRSTRFASLANAVLRRMTREKSQLLARLEVEGFAKTAMAPWLFKRTKKAYGRERAEAIAAQQMLEPLIDLTVREDPQGWADRLGGVVVFGNTVRVDRPGKVETWPGYNTGDWWIQDAAASIPARLLGDIRGLNVADLCAAPGGKTAQLAFAEGRITAVEASKDRMVRLKSNFERLKLKAEWTNCDLFEWQPTKTFDAILLDAPCSSTGTMRRHPDVQWAKTPDLVAELAALQEKMILHATRWLRPGGRLVFANCSLDRAEGEDVYAKVIKGLNDLEPDPVSADEVFGIADFITGQGTVRTLPCHLQNIPAPSGSTVDCRRFTGLDGFFAARFRKV